MPLYQFRCRECRATLTLHLDVAQRDLPLDTRCHTCSSGTYKRVFSFVVGEIFEEHWNPSQGAYVSTRRQLEDNAKRAGDEASARLGFDQEFSVIDTHEVSAAELGVDDHGMAATHDAQVAAGVKESAGRFVF